MAIQGIEQPEIIQVSASIRLRKYDGKNEAALQWYQDVETVYLVDGKREPYTMERLNRMYDYLNNAGELFWIEVMEQGAYRPIGDVTFCQNDMPIVIGDRNYRGKRIGRKIVSVLVDRGKALGYDYLEVAEIYNWNGGSRRCFESIGFKAFEKTEKGARYKLYL